MSIVHFQSSLLRNSNRSRGSASGTGLGRAMEASKPHVRNGAILYIYDTFSVIHYFSVFIMVGTTALVDLRVLGVGGQRQTVAQVAKQFTPWIWMAVVVGIVSGFFEFAPGAASFAPDHIFEIKMVVIVLAIA